jgi:hypothetical protein
VQAQISLPLDVAKDIATYRLKNNDRTKIKDYYLIGLM